jgi:hypothetical protein
MADVIPGAIADSGLFFQGADRDAQVLQSELDRAFTSAPPGSVLADPERRRKFGHALTHVVEITASLAVIQTYAPGLVGRALGPLVTGLEKDPGTGKVRPGGGSIGNFAPSPFGFLDPTAVGLPRNFYLPPGATELVPRAADRFGFGLPEQRIEDEARRAQLNALEAVSRTRTAQLAVASESVQTLQDVAAGRGGLSRAGVLFAESPVPATDLQAAAQLELTRRAAGGAVINPLNPEREEIVARALVAQTRGLPVPAPPDAAPPVPDPAQQQPVNDAGRRNEAVRRGIDRELVHERADP